MRPSAADAPLDQGQMVAEAERSLGAVGQRAGVGGAAQTVERKGKGQRLVDRGAVDLAGREALAVDESIEAEPAREVRGDRLGQAEDAVAPGEGGQRELGAEPVARVVGRMEILLEHQGTAARTRCGRRGCCRRRPAASCATAS